MPTPLARYLIKNHLRGAFTVEAGELSLLSVLFTEASGPGAESPETFRVVGGTQQFSLLMAKDLGDRVITNAPVSRIVQSAHGVTVESRAGRFRCHQVLVAISPALAGRIDYDPPLPALRDGLTQRYANGSVIKIQAIYSEPFWRKQGLSGESLNVGFLIDSTFDNCPPEGKPGVLLAFIDGNDARRLVPMPAEARRKKVVEALVTLFGKQAADPEHYIEGDWSSDPWTRGCYAGIPAPGAWVGFGPAWREPVGKIHWASAETATRWNGFMEGAVRAGETAAAGILTRHPGAARGFKGNVQRGKGKGT